MDSRERKVRLPAGRRFQTTRWSLVAAAGRGSSPAARQALSELCEKYWFPLYAFARRQGVEPAQAEDLTQAFFTRLIEKNYLADARRERGRLRTFLLFALRRFLAKERRSARAQKRNPGRPLLRLDLAGAEERFISEPTDSWTPERAFERNWALAVLQEAALKLGRSYEERGEGPLFERLKDSLAGAINTPYQELAAELGVSEELIKVKIHRLRKRFRDLVRREILETVGSAEQVDEEIRFVIRALEG